MVPPARFTDPTRPELVPGIVEVAAGTLERVLREREYFELSGLPKERGLVYAADGKLT